MMEFLAMGGYGAYVWSAYAIVLVVMVLNVVLPVKRHKVLLRMLDELLKMKGGQS